jgi:ATP-binding cassette subfamily C protein CydD
VQLSRRGDLQGPESDAGKVRLRDIERSVAGDLLRAALVSALSSALWPIQAWMVATVVASWLGEEFAISFPLAVAAFTLAGVARAALESNAAKLTFAIGDKVLEDERSRLLKRESPGRREGDQAPAAAIGALVADKIPMLLPHLARYRPAMLRTAVVPVLILLLVLPISWVVFLILVVSGPLIPVFMGLVGLAAREASERQMAEIGTLNSLLADRLSALVDIRLLDARERVAADFADRAESLRARTTAVLRVAFLSSAVLELFAAIGVAMVAVYVGFSLLGELGFGTWGPPLGLRSGLFVLLLAPEFFQPLRDLAAAWHDRASALAVAGELAGLETRQAPQIVGAGNRADPLPGPPGIRMENVTVGGLRLPELDIEPGQHVALTGASGSGKTTVLAALAGLMRPDEGRITVAGLPLDESTAPAWRARLGWIPQTPAFLNASVRANLDLRRTGADPAPALEAAAVADVVAALPGGLNARLGETGGGVSGGEARRLLVARAIVGGGDVILADEPTADLDDATAAKVLRGLLAASRGKTLIVATHDPKVVAALDRQIDLGPAS